jgi:carbon storage regulator CsrA
MLVLTRRDNERIVIGSPGSEIVVTLLTVRADGAVRIGVSADAGVLIDRDEVFVERHGVQSRFPAGVKASKNT